MNRIAQLQVVGHMARRLPGAVMRRGCRSVRSMGESNERFPVVLVHGYVGRESVWTPLRDELARAGFGEVVSIDYNTVFTDPVTVAQEVARLAAAAVTRTGATGVHLVGHSLGGLLVRYAVQLPGIAELTATAVTIATPHRGAPLARIAPGRCAKIMQSPASVAPATRADGLPRVRWLTYYSDGDRVVPTTSARLDGRGFTATNVHVPGCGHLTICRDPRLIRCLVDALIDSEALSFSPVTVLRHAA